MRSLDKPSSLHIAICVFVFVLPISSFWSVRLLVILGAFSIVQSLRNNNNWRMVGSLAWDILIYLFIINIGLLYSTDLLTGFKVIETSFGFLAIPIILREISPLNEDRLYLILFFFVFGLLMGCIVCIINAAIVYMHGGNIVVFLSYQLTSILNYHPTYLAYYLIFAVTLGLYLLFYEKGKIRPLIIIIMITFFFLMLMLTGGQTSFISMLFIFSFFVLKFLIEARSVRKSITFALVCVMVICMFLSNSLDQVSRSSVLNDSWERFILWESAVDATPNVILGVGTGDYKTILNNYYLSHGLVRYATETYNSHNQFIQILLTNGIFGVISVLLLICRPLYLAVKNQQILGVLVFFPFLIYGTTEVFLGRYQGVVFFALLHQVFISYYSSLKPSLASLKGV